jgi:hypothetical protein
MMVVQSLINLKAFIINLFDHRFICEITSGYPLFFIYLPN